MDGGGDLLLLRIGFDLIHWRHGRRKTKEEQLDFPFNTWLFRSRAPPSTVTELRSSSGDLAVPPPPPGPPLGVALTAVGGR